MGRHEEDVLRKVLLCLHDNINQERDCGIRQHRYETLYEYWERFNKLCATCLHHETSEQLLIQYFSKRWMLMYISMIDANSYETLMDKTPPTTRSLISNMASNTQQFGVRGFVASKVVNENIQLMHAPLCRKLNWPHDQYSNLRYGSHLRITKYTNHHLLLDNNNLCSLYNRIPWRIWSSKWPRSSTRTIQLPIPIIAVQARKFEIDDELLQIFNNVEINIPLIDVIKQIAKYAKFLKEFCTNKSKKLKGGMEMGRNVSTLIKSKYASTLI
ncbi:hypothetical protein CR513_06959, partial [Mucuna pruriens]